MEDLSIDLEIAAEVAKYYHDPIGFVNFAFELDDESRVILENWQAELLGAMRDHCVSQMFQGDGEPVMPFKAVVAAGHGVGKSAITAWIILWLMSTRPDTRGVVTAGTQTQLKTKTWAELAKWQDKCITGHWFDLTATAFVHRSYPKTWRVDAMTAREETSDTFAGLHNAESTPFFIFDEASTIADIIWEVAEGGLTDGEPFFIAFGNPVRNTGAFRRKFNSPNWYKAHVDGRDCKGTNKVLIAQWADEYGEDSDFFKIRVKGQFPSSGDKQLIGITTVTSAMSRDLPRHLPNEPLVCGIDVSRGGGDDSFIVFRRGRDGRSEKTYKIGPDKSKDSMLLVSIIAEKMAKHQPQHIFIDASGLGGPIYDRLKQLGFPCTGVQFAGKPDDPMYNNKATEIWFRMKYWLEDGGAIKKSNRLEQELIGREYDTDKAGRLALESKPDMKKRLGEGSSPDWADAIAVTFAHPVHHLPLNQWEHVHNTTNSDYDPMDAMS